MSGSELIRTKLAPPLVGGSLVDRAALLGQLSQGLSRRLTVLVAPAGFGKTTLLAAWHAALSQQGTACAWVTLERDDDLYLFGAYLLEALAVDCGVGRRAQALIRNDPLVPAKNVVSVLINEIAEAGRPIVLILDDLDQLESAPAHEALFRLLRHGPDNFHVVVSGRSAPPLPLSHFQSRNQLLCPDADTLRFDRSDTGRFLHEVAGLKLDAARVQALWQATEGWIAGLQLASIALRNGADAAGIGAGPGAATREIAQYLTENVLATLPGRLVDFLLRLSVLDRVSPALGAAVSGFDDAAALLDELERRNLFLAPLDAARSWYRFHALFADYLRERALRQIPAEIPALHRRASAWLAQQRLWPEAVKHALAAGDEDAAATWVEHSAMALIERSDMRTLRTWLGRLPPHVIHGRLRLRLAEAWCQALSLRPREAVATLHDIQEDLARGILDTHDDAALRCELLAMRALIAGLTDDSPASLRPETSPDTDSGSASDHCPPAVRPARARHP
ncbi:AAA family ATPase, partial [Zoogloea sp.]|uniref:AAA family ATPase n=1 Tax=Zoogloea sp. TaxID=49181 RepID=UPI001AC412B0